ncbi:MAG: zinc ribbon domain-containing protein [Proteobacteria bacterium]|nr:zinc ribbon domain-containing protein [Pseudomonadota bacterium]
MFCSNCGSQNQDGSKFCNSCGKPTSGLTPTMTPFTDLPPKFISEVGVAFDNPQSKNFLGKSFSTARVYFALLDESRRPTRCVGTAKVRILQRKMDLLYIIETKPSIYESSFNVNFEGFRQSTITPNFWGFYYYSEKPILKEGEVYFAEVWFKTKNGAELYGTDKK